MILVEKHLFGENLSLKHKLLMNENKKWRKKMNEQITWK